MAAAGGLLLVAAVGWSAFDRSLARQCAYSFLVAYLWAVTVAVGALLWLVLEHLIGARWHVALRRLAELLSSPLPWLAGLGMLLLPVVVRGPLVYRWVDLNLPAGRATYLQPGNFVVRGTVFLAVWTWLALYFQRYSQLQDRTQAPELVAVMRRASAPALLVLMLTLTWASIDWIMSLDPGWSSSILGVYFMLGCVVAGLAGLSAITLAFGGSRELKRTLKPQHYRDLARSLLTFVLLWAFASFCQFLLLWYTNLPGEAGWLARRLQGSWAIMSGALALAWLLPLLGLLSEASRRDARWLGFWGGWLLVAHYLDLYWLIMPEATRSGPPVHLLDLLCFFGFLGCFLAVLVQGAKAHGLVVRGDPRLIWIEEELPAERV